jgi:hypothetical protein
LVIRARWQALLEAGRVTELARVFLLLAPVPNGVTALAKVLQATATQDGRRRLHVALVGSEQAAPDASATACVLYG